MPSLVERYVENASLQELGTTGQQSPVPHSSGSLTHANSTTKPHAGPCERTEESQASSSSGGTIEKSDITHMNRKATRTAEWGRPYRSPAPSGAYLATHDAPVPESSGGSSARLPGCSASWVCAVDDLAPMWVSSTTAAREASHFHSQGRAQSWRKDGPSRPPQMTCCRPPSLLHAEAPAAGQRARHPGVCCPCWAITWFI